VNGDVAFALGTDVELLLDETPLEGGAFLMSSVLERFLGHYCSINSFSRLSVRTVQRTDPLAEWPARAGEQILV
jgi:type VI secretion system protein ImpG